MVSPDLGCTQVPSWLHPSYQFLNTRFLGLTLEILLNISGEEPNNLADMYTFLKLLTRLLCAIRLKNTHISFSLPCWDSDFIGPNVDENGCQSSRKHNYWWKNVISLKCLWSEKVCKSLLTSSPLIIQMKTLDFAPKACFSPTPPTNFPHICKWYETHPLVKSQQAWESPFIVISTRELPSLTHVLLFTTSTRKLNSTLIKWKSLQAGSNKACSHRSSDAFSPRFLKSMWASSSLG